MLRRSIPLIIAALLLAFGTAANAEDAAPKKKKARVLGELSSGLYYGHFFSSDDEKFELIVHGLPPNRGKRRFYTDKATKWYGPKKAKYTSKRISLGSRVVVEYFAEKLPTGGEIAVAQRVFLVTADKFVPADYIIRVKPKEPAAAPKAASHH